MDVRHPIRAVMPTLDGPVLEVLTGTTRALTGLEIHRIARTGSPSGIRRTLARLVVQGVVLAQEHATAIFYTGNREHLAWPAIEALVRMRRVLLDRMRDEFGRWSLGPVHASLFGSTARGDGDALSDIDILLVRPDGIGEDESPWADQIDGLRDQVQAWTGNHCQAFQIDTRRLAEHVRVGDPLVEEWLRDSLTLAGIDLKALVRQVQAAESAR